MRIAFSTAYLVVLSICSFAPLTPVIHSAHSLHCTILLSVAHSVYNLALSLCLLPHGKLEIFENVFILKKRLTGTIVFVAVSRNTPKYLIGEESPACDQKVTQSWSLRPAEIWQCPLNADQLYQRTYSSTLY